MKISKIVLLIGLINSICIPISGYIAIILVNILCKHMRLDEGDVTIVKANILFFVLSGFLLLVESVFCVLLRKNADKLTLFIGLMTFFQFSLFAYWTMHILYILSNIDFYLG